MSQTVWEKRCILSKLAQSQLNGCLVGLKVSHGELTLDEKVFPCCQGSGKCLNLNYQSVGHCNLPRRFRAVRRLLLQYHRCWPNARELDPKQINQRSSAAVIDGLRNFLNSELACGRLMRVPQRRGPGDLWLVALTAAWRLGVDCHFVSFGRTPNLELLPPSTERPMAKSILFVEAVSKLHDPAKAFDFEALVSHAYHANMFLVVEIIESAKTQKDTDHKAGRQSPSRSDFSTKNFFFAENVGVAKA